MSWDTEADDAKIDNQVRDTLERANEEAKARGLWNGYEYLNYAARWQDPIAGYGGAVKKELQRVSARYDPGGVFQRQVRGGFKLG